MDTQTEHAVGDFCRSALAAVRPLVDGVDKPTARLEVDGTKYRVSTYLRARIEQRIASAQQSIYLSIAGGDDAFLRRDTQPDQAGGVNLTIWDNPRFAAILLWATVPAEDRPAVGRLGSVLADGLYALATEFEVLHGDVHNTAESTAYYIQTRTPAGSAKDGYESLTDLAWRHVVPAAELTNGIDPALDCVQALPDSSALVALPGDFDEPPTPAARALREAVFRALLPSQSATDYAKGLAERAAWLAPVTVRWDEDIEEVLAAWVETDTAPSAHQDALAWSDRLADVPAWVPARELGDAVHSASEQLPAILEPYGGEALALIHQTSMPKLYPPRSDQLPRIDLAAVAKDLSMPTGRAMFGSTVERYLVPAVAAYLGEVLVTELGGRWLVPDDLPVPPEGSPPVPWAVAHLPLEEQRRIGVVVGSVVVYPFERARLLVDKQRDERGRAFEDSLTKFFRCAKRWLTTPPDREMSPEHLPPLRRLPDTLEPRAHATHLGGRVAVAAEWAIYVFNGARSADGQLEVGEASLIATWASGFTNRLAFAGTDLLVGGTTVGDLHIWDARTGHRHQTFRTGGSRVVTHLVAAGPDTIAFGTEGGRIGLAKPGWSEPALLRRSGNPAGALALSPAGDELFAGMPSAIVRFDVARVAETTRILVPRVIALGHGGDVLGYATEAGEVGTVNFTDGATPQPIGRVEGRARAMFRTADGWVVVTDSTATVFRGSQSVPIELPDQTGPPRTVTLGADGGLLVSRAGGITAIALPVSRPS